MFCTFFVRYARAALEFVEWRRRQVDRAINLDEEKIRYEN